MQPPPLQKFNTGYRLEEEKIRKINNLLLTHFSGGGLERNTPIVVKITDSLTKRDMGTSTELFVPYAKM
jgi:hypothetical protein